jgi:hypothetical protein
MMVPGRLHAIDNETIFEQNKNTCHELGTPHSSIVVDVVDK